MSWTLAVAEREATPHERWALRIDPRTHDVVVLPVVVGVPSSEIGLQAVFQRYLDGRPEDDALAWLASDTAAALLAQVDEGYEASMTWSGDTIGRWTEEAWAAAEQIASLGGAAG